ncbi:ferredoxin reductase family protein [Desulfatiglans anilini]|uniref:ferredoxin reductase family protein n=1 Tax=Desulfatiglans anilini TaxID=90728 RepID=UPI000407035C|nr:ferric reductase-like transmembrane domain-containing protein [Desulfatiglans anilini]
MLTISRIHQKTWPALLTVCLTLVIWLGSKAYYEDWFSDPFKYPAKAASLGATILMCWCVVLSTRLRPIEAFFGGLDKVYQVHKRIGRWAFFLIVLHPIFLSAHNFPDFLVFLQELGFLEPLGDRYLWGHNVGVATFLMMAGLMSLTLWLKIPYHLWKMTHEWFGGVLILAAAHVLIVNRDVTTYPLLRIWVYGFLALALASFVYTRFFYRFYGPRFDYTVSEIAKHGDVIQATLRPVQEKMEFKPSQFVYLVVRKEGITPEPHPYSIASGYNPRNRIKLGIKQSGDHTRSLDRLERGDPVLLYGPYGHFSDRFLSGVGDCVFIAGGIGITPFLGMWHVALHSEERLDPREAPEQLRRMHPELIRTWRSPVVSLFYICRTRGDASFDEDIRQEVAISRFHGFKAFEERGHHYECYITSEQGRITAAYVRERVKGGLQDKNIFLCGPSPMVASFVEQLSALGVRARQIIVEDFNLL